MKSLQSSWIKISEKKMTYRCILHYINEKGEVVTFNKIKDHLATIKQKNDGRWEYTIKKSQFSRLWTAQGVRQGVVNTKQEAIDFVVSFWDIQLLAKLYYIP